MHPWAVINNYFGFSSLGASKTGKPQTVFCFVFSWFCVKKRREMPIWYSFSPLVCVCRSHLFSALPLLPSCGSGTSFFSSFFSRESCCFPILVFCTYKSPSCIVLSISKDRLVSWARCRIWRSLVDKTELVMMVMLWEWGGGRRGKGRGREGEREGEREKEERRWAQGRDAKVSGAGCLSLQHVEHLSNHTASDLQNLKKTKARRGRFDLTSSY